MKKQTKVFVAMFVICAIVSSNVLMVGATSSREKVLKKVSEYNQLLTKEQEIVYEVGKEVYKAKINNKVENEIPQNIYKQIDRLAKFSKEARAYNETLAYQSLERQYMSGIVNIIDNLMNAYNALLSYYYATDYEDAFNESGVFYHYLTYASVTNNWLEKMIERSSKE